MCICVCVCLCGTVLCYTFFYGFLFCRRIDGTPRACVRVRSPSVICVVRRRARLTGALVPPPFPTHTPCGLWSATPRYLCTRPAPPPPTPPSSPCARTCFACWFLIFRRYALSPVCTALRRADSCPSHSSLFPSPHPTPLTFLILFVPAVFMCICVSQYFHCRRVGGGPCAGSCVCAAGVRAALQSWSATRHSPLLVCASLLSQQCPSPPALQNCVPGIPAGHTLCMPACE